MRNKVLKRTQKQETIDLYYFVFIISIWCNRKLRSLGAKQNWKSPPPGDSFWTLKNSVASTFIRTLKVENVTFKFCALYSIYNFTSCFLNNPAAETIKNNFALTTNLKQIKSTDDI
jgi:hypothetical protein